MVVCNSWAERDKKCWSSSSLSLSSSSFNIPSFSLLGSDEIWVTSTVVHPLPYLWWCLTSSCLHPLPYSMSSLAYLLAFYFPHPASNYADIWAKSSCSSKKDTLSNILHLVEIQLVVPISESSQKWIVCTLTGEVDKERRKLRICLGSWRSKELQQNNSIHNQYFPDGVTSVSLKEELL